MTKFSDIPKFPRSTYAVDVSLNYLEKQLECYQEDGLNMNPDFQRHHVWTKKQQTDFLEFWFRGGVVNNSIYFNCPKFSHGHTSFDKFVLVDGKQRLQAILDFLNNKTKVFGHYLNEYEDKRAFLRMTFTIKFHIAELETKKEILEWYLGLNGGGTPHTTEELDRVRKLLDEENGK